MEIRFYTKDMNEILDHFSNTDKLTWKRVWQAGEVQFCVFAYENR